MPEYVHGFVLPVPTKNVKDYQKLAKTAAKVWMDHGALDYRECVMEDSNAQGHLSFPEMVKPKRGETVVFAWITYKSKKDSERVMKLVMEDKRLKCDDGKMPFDVKRMCYGGFETLVKA